MYEYEIYIKAFDEFDIIYGYDWKDALRRAHLEGADTVYQVVCLNATYID